MNVSTKQLVREAIAEALRVAEQQNAVRLPIGNIDSEALCNRFFRDKEESMAQSGDTNIHWLLAFIECEGELSESPEFEVVVEKIQQGYTVAFDRSESGQYKYNID
jgi:hypothetical protein